MSTHRRPPTLFRRAGRLALGLIVLGGSALAAAPASADTASVQGALQVIQTTSGPAVIGQPLTYTISVTNISTGFASGVMLGDTLPSGLLPTSLLGPGGNPDLCARTRSGAFSCSMGDLAPAATASVIFTGTVPANIGSLTNKAVVQACLGLASPQPAGSCVTMGGTYPTTSVPLTVPVSATALVPAPASAPGAPTTVAGRPGDSQAMVWWNPPTSDGGSPITSYTLASNPPGATATVAAPGTAAILKGLTNGTPYTFTVTATNAAGTSSVSSPSAPITPVAVAVAPQSPTAVSAVGGNAQATVSWTAPVSDGGSPITGYTVTSSPAGASLTVSTPATSATLTGLTNGTAYTFTVAATNRAGRSPASTASNSVTPITTAGAPTAVSALAGNAQATVSWTAPVSNGGSVITSYLVSSSPAGASQTVAAPATSATVTGLTNGTAYTFTVTAVNGAGNSAPSLASNSVIPVAPVPPHAAAPTWSLAGLTTAQVGTAATVAQAGPLTAATSGVPVTVSWGCFVDPIALPSPANCDHYALQQSINGGPFTNVTLASPAATSATLNLTPSPSNNSAPATSYVFRVQAFDVAGNAGPFATAASMSVADTDNSFSSSFNGSWSGVNLSSAFGGSVHESSTAGATAGPANAAPATSLAWVSTTGPDRGLAQVKVDGQVVATVDLYAPAQKTAQLVWAINGLAPGANHNVQIVALGTKNTAATAAKVDYDAIVALK